MPIGVDTNWLAVSCAGYSSYGLKSDGTLWLCGQSTTGSVYAPTQIGTNRNWIGLPKGRSDNSPTALQADGTRWQLADSFTNAQPLAGNDWSVVAGDGLIGHWAIKRDGTLWKELTVLDTNQSWSSVSVAVYHGLAIRTNGTLWAWMTPCCGIALEGQLGLGNALPSLPTQIGTDTWATVSAGIHHSIGIKNDGSLWWWGANLGFDPDVTHIPQTNAPVQFGTNKEWIAVSAGDLHSVALRTDGTVWTFGYNELGKLGNATVGVIKEPMRVGSDNDWSSVATGTTFSFGQKTNGTLWSWGLNTYGVLGVGDFANGFTPRPLPGSNWIAVSGGSDFATALQSDGSLWVWGKYVRSTINRSLDLFTNQPTQLGTNTDWLHISAGNRHALAVRQDSTLWAWGSSGTSGALGTGSFSDIQNIPIQIQTGSLGWSNVSAGYQTSLGLRGPALILWVWGQSIGNLLGNTQPHQVPNGAGGWANTALAKYHFNNSAHALTRGHYGTLWACGANSWGQLGMNNFSYANDLAQIGTATNWSNIAIGDMFSGAMRTDGTLWMTGFNFYGQIGSGLRASTNLFTRVGAETNWTAFAAGIRHVVAVKSDGSLWAWGDNSYGQCAQPALFEAVPVAGTNWGRPQ